MTKDNKISKAIFFVLPYIFITIRILCMFVFDSNFAVTLSLKMLASFSVVLFAFLLLRKNLFTEGKFIFAGLCLCFVADFLLEISFIPGGFVFGAAHFIFLIGFIKTKKIERKQFILLGILMVVSVPLFIIFKGFFTGILPLVIAYFTLLFCIISFSITHRKLLVIATILFFISDICLVIDVFIYHSVPFSICCLASYYTSLNLFALTCEKK